MTERDEKSVIDVSVLIVGYRSRACIGRCLTALSRQTVRPREVFLVENGSPDGEKIDASDVPDWVHFIDNDENIGFAAANNQMARLATSRWLALLNPDAFAHDDWLEELLAATLRYPDVALFGSTQYADGRPGYLDGVGDVFHAAGLAYRAGYGRPVSMLPDEGEVFGPCAAAALIRRDVFEALEGFDERFFCYSEDVDLAFRARLSGHRAIQVRAAAVDHAGYGSSGRRSDFATYYGVRNRFWVFLRNTPGWLLWVLLPVHLAIMSMLWISSARFGQFRLFSKAVGDALRELPDLMESRKKVQAARVVSPAKIASAMAWNPIRLVTRSPDIRPAKPAER